jgi:hypothetical protein
MPTITLTGTFNLPETSLTCPDGSIEPRNPASKVAGTMELTVNYASGVASATVEGTGGDVLQQDCGDAPYTLRYILYPSTIAGTVDPATGQLDLEGQVRLGIWNSCWTEGADGSCTGGGNDNNSSSMQLTGTVDVANHLAAGKIRWGGPAAQWGEWQAK